MPLSQPYDERRDLILLAQGSEDAFTRLFDHYRGRIFGVALKFLKSRALAEEVVQEVFLKIWTRREEMSGKLNFQAYLFIMARNQVFDGLKEIAKTTAARKEFSHDIHQVNGTDHSLIEDQYDELLQQAVNQLPPQQKQVFQLAKIEGLSHQAIAEQLHISRLTVKTHMAKALQSIRTRLQRYLTTFILLPIILRNLLP